MTGQITDAEARDRRHFRAVVRNSFLQSPRVQAITNIDPVAYLHESAGTIDAYFPYHEDAMMALGDDFETLSRWAAGGGPKGVKPPEDRLPDVRSQRGYLTKFFLGSQLEDL